MIKMMVFSLRSLMIMMHLACGVCYNFVDKCKQPFDNKKKSFFIYLIVEYKNIKLQKTMKSYSIQDDFSLINY